MKKLFAFALLLTCYCFLFSNVTITHKNQSSYTVNFKAGNYQIETNKNFSYITNSNLSFSNLAKEPNLPSYTKWVIVPPNGNLNVSILGSSSKTIKLTKPFQPVPTVIKTKKLALFLC